MEAKKTAIVTGGTRGIGRAISLDLAKNGFNVIALYARNRQGAEELQEEAKKAGLEIETIRGDLTREKNFAEVITEIKSKASNIDVLVHSAASGVHKPAEELTLKHMRWTFEINVFSIHNLIRELFPLFKDGSKIIGITSGGGQNVIPFYAAVGSSKGALESLFRHYAQEFAPKGITVNLVCPGMVMTDAVEAFPDKEERAKNCLDKTPTGRLTDVDDVAEVVTFLSTTRVGKQLVGQTIEIDGGKGLLR